MFHVCSNLSRVELIPAEARRSAFTIYIVTLNLFQGPFPHNKPRFETEKWMLKQVQHDEFMRKAEDIILM